MPNLKISQMDSAEALDGENLFAVVQEVSAVLENRKVTLSSLLDYFRQIGSFVFSGFNSFDTPADGATYFLGSSGVNNATGQGFCRYYVPAAGKLQRILFQNLRFGTTATSETSSIDLYINGSLHSTILNNTFRNNTQFMLFDSGELNIDVAISDALEFRWVTPTWATNPGTSIIIKNYVFIGDLS